MFAAWLSAVGGLAHKYAAPANIVTATADFMSNTSPSRENECMPQFYCVKSQRSSQSRGLSERRAALAAEARASQSAFVLAVRPSHARRLKSRG